MRGIQDGIQESFLYNFSLESVVPANHPIRVIRRIVDDVLTSMGPILMAFTLPTVGPVFRRNRC